jgi:C-terminal processing protease CtpA/Prc
VLVSPDCASACEGFAHAISQGDRSIIVGHYPTAGMYGEVGRGQYDLPADISMQFPTGRPETLDGELLIENIGIIPDILVPVTEESALGLADTVLEAAIDALLAQIGE